MIQAYKIASTNSSCRKDRHDIKCPLRAVLKQVYCVLFRNLSERGGTRQMRSFWQDKVHVVIENLNSKNISYKVQRENDLNENIHTFHRNMPLSCD